MVPLGQPDPVRFRRRHLLQGVGIACVAVGAAPLLEGRSFAAADAARQAAVSWATAQRVSRPRLRLDAPDSRSAVQAGGPGPALRESQPPKAGPGSLQRDG
jgi:hypothetical protein